ncbi:MAG: phosphatidylserine/phosphatidylglycerophosphate/cardiolipin synthase family protein [Patescibacteria group bacterium]
MLYKFFTNSERAWQAMLEEVKLAEQSIYLEMYTFVDDIKVFNFLKLFEEKAKKGVGVKIILDSFGSSTLSKKAILGLRSSGVELLFHSHFFHKTHRKILLVDEKTAFIGGVNLHKSAKRWADLAVRVRGVLVQRILRSFAKAYADCGGEDKYLLSLRKETKFSKARTWLLEHSPLKNKFYLKKIYKKALHEAKANCILVSPYFMPKLWLERELHQAVLRGVRVEILMPNISDLFWVDRVNHFYMKKMAECGVVFYLGRKMNHAKILIVDEKEALVGSNNLDILSFEFNTEIGIFIKDERAVGQVLAIINNWKKESVLFDPKTYKRKWFDYILSPIFRLLFFL